MFGQLMSCRLPHNFQYRLEHSGRHVNYPPPGGEGPGGWNLWSGEVWQTAYQWAVNWRVQHWLTLKRQHKPHGSGHRPEEGNKAIYIS